MRVSMHHFSSKKSILQQTNKRCRCSGCAKCFITKYTLTRVHVYGCIERGGDFLSLFHLFFFCFSTLSFSSLLSFDVTSGSFLNEQQGHKRISHSLLSSLKIYSLMYISENSSWTPFPYKINRARVSHILTVQQRVIHQSKGNFPKFHLCYNLHTRVAITGC